MNQPEQSEMRARILSEAARLFVEYGYNGISMREIAEAVGVSKAGLYYHYRDKEDLFLAILTGALDDLERIVQRARQEPDTRAQVQLLVRELFAQAPEQRAIMRLADQGMARIDPQLRAQFNQSYERKFIGQVADLVRDGVQRGALRPADPTALAWALLGMIYPFFTPGGRSSERQEELTGLLVGLFLDGAGA